MNKTIFTFVLVFCCASLGVNSSVQEQFMISRTNPNPKDTFNIPASTCSATNSSSLCSNYGLYSVGKPCQCQCSYRKPSFLYQSGKWRCVADKLMKDREGCGFWSSQTSLPFLDQVSVNHVNAPAAQVSQCLVDHADSRYLACDGTWRPIKTAGSNSQFRLIFVSETASERKHELHVNTTSGIPNLRGRIVKLVLTCNPTSGNQCLLFKIKGDFKCPVDPTRPNTTDVLTTRTEESPSTNPTTRKLVTSRKVSRPTSKRFNEGSRPNTFDGNKKARKAQQPSVNVGAIAGGVAASTILLLVLICIALFCMRQRKQRLLRKNFYKVNQPPTPPLNNSDRGEKVPLEKLNFRYMPAELNPIYEGIDGENPVASKTQEPQYMNLSFKGGVKLGVHGQPPVKPARNSLKRESNKAKAARNVNNAGYKNELLQNNPVEPPSSPAGETSEPEEQARRPGDEIYIKINDATNDSEYGDGDDNEWDSFSEAEDDDWQTAHAQEQNKPDEVIYATINDAGANNFVNEVMKAFQQLDKK